MKTPTRFCRLLPGPAWAWRASKECGLSTERILAATQLPFDIRPKDVKALAKALRVDPIWLNHQVMSALYPDAVDMLLNPTYWATPEGISGGILRFGCSHHHADCKHAQERLHRPAIFCHTNVSVRRAGRSDRRDTGSEVEILYGRHQAMTDIGSRAARAISPRKRFNAWLNTKLGARPGDRIRIEKTGDRQYTLSPHRRPTRRRTEAIQSAVMQRFAVSNAVSRP